MAVQSNTLSGGLHATVGGVNSYSQRINLHWIVKYSNLCSSPPYELDDSLGWLVYASSAAPINVITFYFMLRFGVVIPTVVFGFLSLRPFQTGDSPARPKTCASPVLNPFRPAVPWRAMRLCRVPPLQTGRRQVDSCLPPPLLNVRRRRNGRR